MNLEGQKISCVRVKRVRERLVGSLSLCRERPYLTVVMRDQDRDGESLSVSVVNLT